ncbi:MAG TPA: Maf family protein [Solirubrobacteraceae bacterium]|nr:Maf family protein [Solirubrobacteraceae bacterium]
MRLVLASASPQRRAILAQLGIPFELRPAHVEEIEAGDPGQAALENARRKAAAAAAAGGPGEVVLGVDTIVALEGEIFGKPPGPEAAAATLGRLQGRVHLVHSGIALLEDGCEPRTALATTAVRFRALDEEGIARYVSTGEWQGRAGGYAIQGRGALLVAEIEGDYLNVVGLPVAALVDLWPAMAGL